MGCLYCEKNEKMQSFTYPVCELSTSDLYLNREQSYPGRCILVLRRHAEEFCELTKEERAALQEDLARVTAALKKLYQPGRSTSVCLEIPCAISISILSPNMPMGWIGTVFSR